MKIMMSKKNLHSIVKFVTSSSQFLKGFLLRTIAKAALAKRAEKFLLPEKKWIYGDVHARPVGDILSEHMST